MNLAANMWTTVASLYDSILLRTLGLIAALIIVVTLLVNGGIAWMIFADQRRLRRRARATGYTIGELMDGDEWARRNGHLDEATETWVIDPAPAMPPSLAAHIAAHAAAGDLDAEWQKVWAAMGGEAS